MRGRPKEGRGLTRATLRPPLRAGSRRTPKRLTQAPGRPTACLPGPVGQLDRHPIRHNGLALDTPRPRAGRSRSPLRLLTRVVRHRLLDELAAAEEVLTRASALVPACRSASPGRPNPCYLEVHWRWGMLDMSLGRRREGLEKVETSLGGYQDLGGPGHNLNGDGVTSMRRARARILFALKEYDAAAADYSACLERSPMGSQLWLDTYQNVATALANAGPEGRERAWKLLGKQRLSFRTTVMRSSSPISRPCAKVPPDLRPSLDWHSS